MSQPEGDTVARPGSLPPAAIGALAAARTGRGLFGIGLAAFAWLALTAGLRPLALPDEGRYVGVAREMLRAGDWLVPTLDGLPYFHKPPLFYWITAAAMALFGENQAAARLAPIVGAWLAAMALFLFARRWAGERTARLALVALLSMPLAYSGAQYANMDMLVAGCITATVLLLAHAVLSLEASLPHRGALVGAYAAAALGVLAKGLIGAVLPVLVILAWLLAVRRLRLVWPMLSATGLALFAVIALPWFAALQWRHPGFLDYFFVVQQFERFAATGYNNVRPFWFYLAVLVAASLPWLPWFGRLARRPGGPRGLRALMLVWPAVVTLFFSIPQSKIPGYIFPALAPLAWLLAEALQARGEPTRRARRLWAASAIASAALGLAVVIGLTVKPYRSTRTLGLALAHEAAAGPPPAVFMLRNDYFDIPFYAGLTTPVQVVDDWGTPSVRERDNWRKELADAADFAPAGKASPLVTPAGLAARACVSPVNWFIGATDSPARFGFLALARVVATTPDATLWRLDANRPGVAEALGCPR